MNPNSETARKIVQLSEAYRNRGRFLALREELQDELTDLQDAVRIADELLRADHQARAAYDLGNEAEGMSADLRAERLGVELHDLASTFVCEGCGEPSAPDHELAETVLSPPVSGYEPELGLYHPDCAAYAASELVR